MTQDAPLNVRNATAFYRAIELFPNFFKQILGENEGQALYQTAMIWRELSNEERKNALKEARKTNAASIEQESDGANS